MTNYIGLLPGDAENRYLIIGLVLISAGFMMATGVSLSREPGERRSTRVSESQRCDSPQTYPQPVDNRTGSRARYSTG